MTPRSNVGPVPAAASDPLVAEQPPGPSRWLAPRRLAVGGTGALLAFCALVALVSLAVPAMIGYDPWAWLVWGRELTRGELSTDGGPTWKPLPVLVTTALAPLGDAAPQAWLVVARAGGLFGMVLTYRLATRFAGPGAGAVAAVALLLTPDDEARWIRHLLQGNVEPLAVGLCLWAVQRHLDGRRGQAVLLGAAVALLRPEAWPIFALYTGWLLWREPRRWRVIVPIVSAVPLLWFGGDWFASGDPWSGADRAQVLAGSTAARLILALEHAWAVVVPPVWVAAAVGVVWAARRREWPPVVLAAGAVAWLAVVVAMATVFGYAALGRFLSPAAAVLCVLGGIAVATAVSTVRGVGRRLATALVLVLVAAPFTGSRVQWLPMQLSASAEQAALHEDLLLAVAAAGGRDGVLACGGLAVDSTGTTSDPRPALSWALDVPLATVEYRLGDRPGVLIARTGKAAETTRSAQPAGDRRVLARTEGWTVYAQRCRSG